MLARLSSETESFSTTLTRLASRLVSVEAADANVVSSDWLKFDEKSHRPSAPSGSRNWAVISARLVATGRALKASAFKLDVACALLVRTAANWLVRLSICGNACSTSLAIFSSRCVTAGDSSESNQYLDSGV